MNLWSAAASIMPFPPVPKAVLYYTPTSVWSSAALLALEEKGYGSDELDRKIVDMKSGENYAPAYIRINSNATVPTLVVPLERTLDAGIPNKYRALTDSKPVLEFLDKSRSAVSSTHTTSSAPAPALAPATIALSDISHAIIKLVHSVPVSNLSLAVTTPEGLSAQAHSPRAEYVRGRVAALHKYLEEDSESVNDTVKRLWETRYAENSVFVRAYATADKAAAELTAQEKQEREAFFAKSVETWTGLKHILSKLEKDFIGPYALGDQISLADLHVGAWLTRIFFVSGVPSPSGQATPKSGNAQRPMDLGFISVEEVVRGHTGDTTFTLGPKLRAFWEVLKERESWRKVYADGLH